MKAIAILSIIIIVAALGIVGIISSISSEKMLMRLDVKMNPEVAATDSHLLEIWLFTNFSC